MPQTQTSCPNCRQPVIVEIEQLFDVGVDPQNKQRILSGMANHISCPNCRFEGSAAVPIVYHDPEKELLLTYFPPEMGLPLNEQEKRIGPIINKVFNNLPAEKRRAYLLQPKTMLTMQTMIETILQADGITKEMIQAQQKKISLIERLVNSTPDVRKELIKQEDKIIDREFFSIFSRIIQVSLQQGDQQGAQMLAALQQDLLSESTAGKELAEQSKEAEAAVKSLQDAGKEGLTREKLLDLIITAPTETRLTTLVSLARSGIDYSFYEMLTKRIDEAKADEKEKLLKLRTTILEITDQIDQAMKLELEQTKKLLDSILASPNISEATMQNINSVNDLFVDLVKSELQSARQQGDLAKSGKLQQVFDVLQKLSAPPPEYEFIEELLSSSDDDEIIRKLSQNPDKLTPEFLQLLNGVITQGEQQDKDMEGLESMKKVYKMALRQSMKANLKK